MPTTNVEFWQRKFTENCKRDERKIDEMMKLGWRVFVVWECATKKSDDLCVVLPDFLEGESDFGQT